MSGYTLIHVMLHIRYLNLQQKKDLELIRSVSFYKDNATKIGKTLRNAGGSAAGADKILEYIKKYDER